MASLERSLAIAHKFKTHGIVALASVSHDDLLQLIADADDAYYNGNGHTVFLSDAQYDLLRAHIAVTESKIGAPVHPKKQKVKLPYFMGSMNKIKPDTNALVSWTDKFPGPYVLSCKLDGVSGLYVRRVDGSTRLYTRGDGTMGQDVSHILPYLRLPSASGGGSSTYAVRGEFIISRTKFDAKYKTTFANARNLVAGLLNQKTVNEDAMTQDVHFVAYELIGMPSHAVPSAQFRWLQERGWEVATHHANVPQLTHDLLSHQLLAWRTGEPYENDGVIVTSDHVYPRVADGNPVHSVAFKMALTEQMAEATVVDVLWTPSKDGYLKPRIQIEPVTLCGVTITYATGFNAAFIRSHGIGVGAVVQLIRSGDVIPHVCGVLVPATHPKLPLDPDSYEWTATGVDIVLRDPTGNDTVRGKNVVGFFRGIGLAGLSDGNVRRLMDAGYDTVAKIVHMNKEAFLRVDGFKDKTADKLYEGIRDALGRVSLAKLVAATHVMGRGISEKKIQLILDAGVPVDNVDAIATLDGIGPATATCFVEALPQLEIFLRETGLYSRWTELMHVAARRASGPDSSASSSASASASASASSVSHKTVVFSGFRDNDLQEQLKRMGITLAPNVTKQTELVVIKNADDRETTKVLDAKKYNIRIVTLEEFRRML